MHWGMTLLQTKLSFDKLITFILYINKYIISYNCFLIVIKTDLNRTAPVVRLKMKSSEDSRGPCAAAPVLDLGKGVFPIPERVDCLEFRQ